MPDFLLELLTEEIPARMQARAIEQLYDRLTDGLLNSGLRDLNAGVPAPQVATYVTPRRLVAVVHGLPEMSGDAQHEFRGPRVGAPEVAISGFLKSAGVSRDQLQDRADPKGSFFYAIKVIPGRSAETILADLIPAIVRDFDWPKSMRWGDASVTTSSPRWVRPLSGIVALLGDRQVPFEAAGVASGRTTYGHRFMSDGPIEIASAATYAAQLRAAHVMLDAGERRAVILSGAQAAAAAGLTLIPDDGLVAENAGLTEWPVPLLGRFDPAFLDVPREVIQLTMRTNQKYFACTDADGNLAPAFVCVANIAADDGGSAIVAGNRKVLAARLADAKFFWDADLARVRDGGLESFAPKLGDIVFHEKLGTVADKVERVAKLARWLVESGAVPGADAQLAEDAARLCKADLVSATVGEFPEVQGIAGGHLALAQGLDPQIAAAIRDHYKPVGPSDEVPTAPVTVAVALADKLDTLVGFFAIGEQPTGSRDPYAMRRAAIGVLAMMIQSGIALSFSELVRTAYSYFAAWTTEGFELALFQRDEDGDAVDYRGLTERNVSLFAGSELRLFRFGRFGQSADGSPDDDDTSASARFLSSLSVARLVLDFLIDRLKVQQREAGVRPDIIDAVFALGGEDDLVRLLARVRAVQAFVDTPDGTTLLAGYRRAANILKIEEAKDRGAGAARSGADSGAAGDSPAEPAAAVAAAGPAPAEKALSGTLDGIVPQVAAAVAAEDFTAAMTALAALRAPVDAFFETVVVNDPDPTLRANRLNLLKRLRTAVHSVADFGRIDK